MRDAVLLESEAASKRLDHVDSLPVGSGLLSANLFLRGDMDGGLGGGSLDYEHRATDRLSLFGQGWAGYGWGDLSGLGYGASAGLRLRF